MAVPRHMPQSAVSGEMLAIALLSMVLDRGQPDGDEHFRGSVTCLADCSAVISMFRRWSAGRDLRNFPYAGVFRGTGVPYIGSIQKVDAHIWEEDARRQGWHRDWVGNNLADEFAGRARPALTEPPRPWVMELSLIHI